MFLCLNLYLSVYSNYGLFIPILDCLKFNGFADLFIYRWMLYLLADSCKYYVEWLNELLSVSHWQTLMDSYATLLKEHLQKGVFIVCWKMCSYVAVIC